jgi:hypothetical protein
MHRCYDPDDIVHTHFLPTAAIQVGTHGSRPTPPSWPRSCSAGLAAEIDQYLAALRALLACGAAGAELGDRAAVFGLGGELAYPGDDGGADGDRRLHGAGWPLISHVKEDGKNPGPPTAARHQHRQRARPDTRQ